VGQQLAYGRAEGLAAALADEFIPVKDAQTRVEDDDPHLDLFNQGSSKIQRAAFHDVARFFAVERLAGVEIRFVSYFVVRSV
jgi:hypothetical protein